MWEVYFINVLSDLYVGLSSQGNLEQQSLAKLEH